MEAGGGFVSRDFLLPSRVRIKSHGDLTCDKLQEVYDKKCCKPRRV